MQRISSAIHRHLHPASVLPARHGRREDILVRAVRVIRILDLRKAERAVEEEVVLQLEASRQRCLIDIRVIAGAAVHLCAHEVRADLVLSRQVVVDAEVVLLGVVAHRIADDVIAVRPTILVFLVLIPERVRRGVFERHVP